MEGDTLILKDVVIYGTGESALTGLRGVLLAARTRLANEATLMGFKKLRIIGQRVPSSSSANPGHIIDITVKLTR